MSKKNMQKSRVIEKLTKELKTSDKEFADGFNKILLDIKINLAKGVNVTLWGFGTFKIKENKARNGRNPKTQEKMFIPKKKVVKFVPSKLLKKAINEQNPEYFKENKLENKNKE